MEIDNVKMWVGDMTVEQAALDQITNISKLPILAGHMAIMPDVHMGKGATVGSVIPTRSAIIPAAAGVDLGCGLFSVRTNLVASDLPDSLSTLRADIERVIPVGFSEHPDTPVAIGVNADKFKNQISIMMSRWEKLVIKPYLGRADAAKIGRQIGTLGGGNHFIEIELSDTGEVWIMLHSGSRGIGNQIGTVAIEMAKKQSANRAYQLPDADLAWLDEGTPEFDAYIEGMLWAQDYALLNRDMMMELVIGVMKQHFPHMITIGELIQCHHNYTSLEEHFNEKMWVTRKGAVSAQLGQYGVIPGSMGTKSFIVQGKGNADSYCSCSHGAGRKMSRNQAKKMFTALDLAEQTKGVECRKDADVIDEIPGAYKNIDTVMSAQTDLVDIVATLKQVLCIKG